MLTPEERMQEIVRRVMAMTDRQQDVMLADAGETSSSSSRGTIGATSRVGFDLIPPPTTVRQSTVAPTDGLTPGGADAASTTIESVPVPPKKQIPIPVGGGSIRNLATTLPPVMPSTLKPLSSFHKGDFSAGEVKEKIQNLSSQHCLQTFASIRSSDNRIRILHSIGKYVAPLGSEDKDRNHNSFFCFKGDRTKRCDPPAVHFKTSFLSTARVRLPTIEDIMLHYGGGQACSHHADKRH